MKKYTLILYLSFVLIGCKEKPTYNPFDNQFNIDEDYFIKDKLDTIWDTCGYYNLSKKELNFEILYGYYGPNLLGKAFSMPIDTIKLKSKYEFRKRDSINSISFDIEKLNLALNKYNYEFYSQFEDYVLISNKINNTIDTASIISKNNDYENFLRTFVFVKHNKKYKNW